MAFFMFRTNEIQNLFILFKEKYKITNSKVEDYIKT